MQTCLLAEPAGNNNSSLSSSESHVHSKLIPYLMASILRNSLRAATRARCLGVVRLICAFMAARHSVLPHSLTEHLPPRHASIPRMLQ
jgi:hypothetical protein